MSRYAGPPRIWRDEVTTLVDDVLGTSVTREASDEVVEALLTAGREAIAETGIRRLRMDDVARRAGCGRATLYRRFATRDELVRAVVTREAEGTLRTIGTRLVAIPTLAERITEAFAATVEQARTNSLWGRLLEVQPDLLLPFITVEGASSLDIARRLMARLLREGQSDGELNGLDPDVAADMIVRIAHSMLLTPEGPIGLDDPKALREFARDYLVGALFRLTT